MVTATLIIGTSPAGAATVPARQLSIASFEGHTIDLSKGWGMAHACLVWHEHGILQCFRTDTELRARLLQANQPNAAPLVDTCSSSLDLYSGSTYSGMHLAMRDRGYWQELSNYGFNDITDSFLGGACSFHLAQGSYGQGYWYPGNTGAWSFAADMGSWDNTVSSVYIN